MRLRVKINSKILKKLNPCIERHSNWLNHYKNFEGDILEFLELDKITAQDKIWASVRVLPRQLIEIFAIDCAVSAALANPVHAYAAADAAAYAAAYVDNDGAYAAYDAAYAAAFVASTAIYAEQENQVDALIMLIKMWVNK